MDKGQSTFNQSEVTAYKYLNTCTPYSHFILKVANAGLF